jgi:hypothetical protein
MLKKYLCAIFQSFYKPELYREAIFNWKGYGGRYLMVFAVLLAAILAASFYISLYQFQQKDLPFITKQIPTMTVIDGIVSVTEKQPVIVQSQDKNFTMTIDTKKSAADLRATKSTVAIGKDFLLIHGMDNSYQMMDLKSIKGKLLIDEDNIYKFIHIFKIVAVPLLWVGQLINLLLKVMVVTFFSYVVTAFMREEYDFLARMRLSALALTPPTIITTIVAIALNHDIAPWFFMLASCLYMYVMIVLMRRLPPVDPVFSQVI